MEKISDSKDSHKNIQKSGNSLSLCSTNTFSKDDLGEQVKNQSDFHTEILYTLQLYTKLKTLLNYAGSHL